ncbi:MAG: bifunctional folylpolyglutamate synthase/dihydrofolate synthase, partial [Candidatus Limnocylindrales bacterium]
MTADYAATLAALQARGRFGIRLGLGRTRALLQALGNPERDLRGVLIAGTNGKGSVQAMVAACLAAAGLHVGQTPKPHLVSYRERVLIDGAPLAQDEFARLLDEVLGIADRLAGRIGPPTEFEVLTAAAFVAFARAGVEVGVVEVGLGGRLDATN